MKYLWGGQPDGRQKEDVMRAEMMRLAARCKEIAIEADKNSKGTTHTLLNHDEVECVIRLAECVEAMDTWLAKGNPLPLEWVNDGTVGRYFDHDE